MDVEAETECAGLLAAYGERIDHLGRSMDVVKSGVESLRGDTFQLVSEMDKRFSRRFTKVDEDLAELLKRIEALEAKEAASSASQAVGWPSLARNSGSSAGSTAAPSELLDLASSAFFRSPDPTLVRVRAEKLVPQQSALAAMEALIATAGLEKRCLVWERTQTVAKNFTARMEGDQLLAARRIQKLLLAQRREDGQWAQFEIKDAEGNPTKAWIDIDKSRAQIRLEMVSKKALACLRAKFPADAEAIRLRKSEGAITLAWSPLLRIKVLDEESYATRWNQAAIEQKGWQQSVLEAAVRQHVAQATPEVRWG